MESHKPTPPTRENQYMHALTHTYIPPPTPELADRLKLVDQALHKTTGSIRAAWDILHLRRAWQFVSFDPVLLPLTLLWQEVKHVHACVKEGLLLDFLVDAVIEALEKNFIARCKEMVEAVERLVEMEGRDEEYRGEELMSEAGRKFEDLRLRVEQAEDLEMLKEEVGVLFPLGEGVKDAVENVVRVFRGFVRMRLRYTGLLNQARLEALERDEREKRSGVSMSGLLIGGWGSGNR